MIASCEMRDASAPCVSDDVEALRLHHPHHLMPPKKAEKGGKGAATSGLKSGEEPPQPGPGAPYCLSLVLEVSLDAAEPRSLVDIHTSGENTAAKPPGEGSGDDAIRDEGRLPLVEPEFRYTFVNGERITTPSIGRPGSSWVKVDPAPTAHTGTASPQQQSAAASPEAEEATAATEPQDIDKGPPNHIAWRYTRVHQLQGADDDQVARLLDQKPMMLVTLADKSTPGGTVQPPGRGDGGDPGNNGSSNEAAGSEISLPGRNFIESWPLDLSAFLAGEDSVNVYAGDPCENQDTASTRNASPQERTPAANSSSCGAEHSLVSKSFAAAAAPEGIRYMRLSVSLRGAGIASGDTALASEEDSSRPGSRPGSSEGATMGRAIGHPTLLSVEAMERLNPLSIKITSAASLPGVRIEAESLQGHVKPTPFRLLELHCKPVYVVCRPFPDGPLGGSLHPRVVWTPRSARRDRAQFDHTSSFLVGPMDRHRLEDWVENSTLSVEVHDRDPLPSAKERAEKVIRLERMVAGGYPVQVGDRDPSEDENHPKVEVKDNGDAAEGGNEPPPVRFAGPRDIYEVDALVLREETTAAASAGKHHAHGVASFHLSGLLDQSRQLVKAYSSSKHGSNGDVSAPEAVVASPPPLLSDTAPRLKIRSEVCQRKRREIPKGGVDDWHLTDEERFVRWPGAYLDAGSTLGIRVSLAKSLRTLEEGSAERTGPATREPRPFTRAVLVVEYEEGGRVLRKVTAAMDEINGRALADVRGSLRAYVFTPEEKQAVDDGALDVVCGFMVIDEDSRTIVLEGLAGPHGGLTALLGKVGRTGPNGPTYRFLENPEVRFSRRLYTCFDADLKKVRLRDTLPILCQNPEIYDRSKVSADCFDALHSLRMLREVEWLREAAEQSLFPEAAQLVQVESKYGESISVKDITGRNPVKKRRGRAGVLGDGGPRVAPADGYCTARLGDGGEAATSQQEEERQGIGAEPNVPSRRKAPTDSSNVAFEEWLRGRRPRDFLAEQEEVVANNHREFLERQRRREEELQAETVPTDWCYGPQKLNYVELKKAEMRERLVKEKGATFTYSMDYVSQTVSLVDESRLREDQQAKSRAAWKTKRGFVWPCPRTRQELITHPSKPSQSRIETLAEPWIENELTGGGANELAGGARDGGPPDLSWRREFDTVPSNGKAVFGGLQPSEYQRPLNTDMIGNRSRLPRGRQCLDKDPEFFRSVHLVGEGLAREKEESKRRAEELWRSKVVVDDTDFRVGNFSVRDRPLQVDRAKDILHSPIRKTAFKMVRNARLPSGKRAPLRPAPVSAFSLEAFSEPEDFTVSIRGNHRERWATADSTSDDKLDFYLRLHRDRMKHKSHKSCARVKHPPLSPSEMRGPRWETGRGRRSRALAAAAAAAAAQKGS